MAQTTLYELNLDFAKEMNYTKAILARQGDKGITLTVNGFLHGLPMIADEHGFFTLKATTPTGLYVDAPTISVDGNHMVFQLDGRFLVEAGYYQRCYVEYRNQESVYTTQDIILYTTKISDPSEGEAKAYISQLEQLIEKYNQTFDEFMAKVNEDVIEVNNQLNNATEQLNQLETKLAELKSQIEALGRFRVKYSNDIDLASQPDPNTTNAKYRGLGLVDSEDNNNYSWDLSPEYVEQNLATPEVKEGLVNEAKEYTDGVKNEVDDDVASLTNALTQLQDEFNAYKNRKVKFHGIYGSGEEHTNFPSKGRLTTGKLLGTAQTMTGQPMESEPLQWNGRRWEGTVLRDCTIRFNASLLVETGADNTGSYIYLDVWSNTEQTTYRMQGGGIGIQGGTKLWFRQFLNFSHVFELKKGEKFSYGVSFAGGKLTKALSKSIEIQEL